MGLYEPRVKLVEAHKNADGTYCAKFDGEWVEMDGEDFEGAYEAVPDRRASPTKADKPAPSRDPERRGTGPKGGKNAAAVEKRRERRAGRKPVAWTCHACGGETFGQKCTHCGKWKQPKATKATGAKPAAVSAGDTTEAGWMQ
jgi:hypothetical protein